MQWLTGNSGELLIYTRGDYREQLLNNIHMFPSQKERQFPHVATQQAENDAARDGWISVKDRLPKTEYECTSCDMMVSNSFFVRVIAKDGGEGFGMADYQDDGNGTATVATTTSCISSR